MLTRIWTRQMFKEALEILKPSTNSLPYDITANPTIENFNKLFVCSDSNDSSSRDTLCENEHLRPEKGAEAKFAKFYITLVSREERFRPVIDPTASFFDFILSARLIQFDFAVYHFLDPILQNRANMDTLSYTDLPPDMIRQMSPVTHCAFFATCVRGHKSDCGCKIPINFEIIKWLHAHRDTLVDACLSSKISMLILSYEQMAYCIVEKYDIFDYTSAIISDIQFRIYLAEHESYEFMSIMAPIDDINRTLTREIIPLINMTREVAWLFAIPFANEIRDIEVAKTIALRIHEDGNLRLNALDQRIHKAVLQIVEKRFGKSTVWKILPDKYQKNVKYIIRYHDGKTLYPELYPDAECAEWILRHTRGANHSDVMHICDKYKNAQIRHLGAQACGCSDFSDHFNTSAMSYDDNIVCVKRYDQFLIEMQLIDPDLMRKALKIFPARIVDFSRYVERNVVRRAMLNLSKLASVKDYKNPYTITTTNQMLMMAKLFNTSIKKIFVKQSGKYTSVSKSSKIYAPNGLDLCLDRQLAFARDFADTPPDMIFHIV